MMGPSAIFECGPQALRLLTFDDFPISLMRTIGKTQRAILVGPSNLPLFGPQGKHRGFEDCLVIDLGLRNLQFRVMALRIVSRLDSHAFQSKVPPWLPAICFDTLHTWVIMLTVGLEPTHWR